MPPLLFRMPFNQDAEFFKDFFYEKSYFVTTIVPV